MEQFIVIAKKEADGRYSDYKVFPVNESNPIPAGYEKLFGPAGSEECVKWIEENRPAQTNQPETGKTWASYASEGWTSYVFVTIVLLFILFLTEQVSNRWVKSEAEEITKELEMVEDSNEKQWTCAIVGTQEKQNFVKQQRAEIIKDGNAHRVAAIEFLGYFSSTYAVFSVFGVLAAVSLAIIVRKGIDEVDSRLITVFLVSTAIVVVYQGFFGVFQHKNNSDNNAKLFVSYARMLSRIDTYCTTGKLTLIDPSGVFNERIPKTTPTPPSANTTATNANATPKPTGTPQTGSTTKPATFYISPEPDEFINYIGWQMEQLKTLSVMIDDTKIVAIDGNKFIITQP